MKKISYRYTISLIGLVCGTAWSGFAAIPAHNDLGAPAWRDGSGTTKQAWTFASTNSTAPDAGFISPGAPAVTVSFGTTGTNSHWKATFPWDKQGIISGVWNVDPNGSFSFDIPGTVTTGTRYAQVQVTEFQYPTNNYATNISYGFSTIGGGTAVASSLYDTGATNGMGAHWLDRAVTLRLPTAGSSEAVTVTPNSDGSAFDAVVIDTLTVADIVCPGDFSVPLASAGSVTWSAPTPVQDGSIITSQVCNPASGTPFALGPTLVNCSNTDLYGKVTTCSFTVTVLPPAGATISGAIALDQYRGPGYDGAGSVDVIFAATDGGTFTNRYTNTVNLLGIDVNGDGAGTYSVLVPLGTIRFSAMTVWHIRRTFGNTSNPDNQGSIGTTPDLSFDAGQATVDFVGAYKLLGGNADTGYPNQIDTDDYSLLLTSWYTALGDEGFSAAPDFNGDLQIDTDDFSILLSNWYQVGDDE